jgi:pyoverdine/dityrosine biosynthesis protein Dit1/AcrR family transcriptional regulator
VDAQLTRSRQRILESAVALLREQGLSGEGQLVDSAAQAARVPVASARLFFHNDEELILAFYLRITSDLQLRAAALPDGGVSERFRALFVGKLELAGAYREAFAGLFAKMLDPRANIGVLSPQTELVRMRSRAAFANVVHGADDASSAPDDATQLTQSLYAAHLALLLIWSQDRSPDLKSTHAALELVCKLIDVFCRFRWMPLPGNLLENVSAIAGPLVDPPADPASTAVAREILGIIFRHRRLLPDAEKCATPAPQKSHDKSQSTDNLCEHCLAPHLPLVRRFVGAGLPVHFVLPAFPAKSPNPEKVLGTSPDLAEEISLQFLEQLCSEIGKIHGPGARITICSDGLVFSDLVGVADSNVLSYGKEISAMIEQLDLSSLETFHMQDLYDEATSIPQMRESLCRHYAETAESIHQRLHSNKNQQALFNGIQRFLFEDRVVIDKGKSRTRIREECKTRTYEVVQRSDAWGRLVADCFPASLRLSIHPQPAHSEKIGILLGESPDVWLTPWHGVALKHNGAFRLVKRREAEETGASIVTKNGRPYFMEIPS